MGAGAGAFCGLLVLFFFYHRLKKKFHLEALKQNVEATVEACYGYH